MIRNEAPIYKKDEEKAIFKVKSAAEKQRLRLGRLMSDPVAEMLNERAVISSETVAETVATLQSSSQAGEKPHAKLNKVVVIPERSKDHAPKAPPEFIRNIWGSSAGVGSGDFHIYRGIRRREYARQKYNQYLKEKEEKDRQFDEKMKKNVESAEAKTAKKRTKRLKRKERLKRKRQQKKESEESESEESSSEEEEESQEEPQKTGEEVEQGHREEVEEDHQVEKVEKDNSSSEEPQQKEEEEQESSSDDDSHRESSSDDSSSS